MSVQFKDLLYLQFVFLVNGNWQKADRKMLLKIDFRSTYYIVNRWSKNAPIIAGKRKKRSNKDLTVKNIEEILNETYLKIVTEMESKSNSRNKNEEDKDEGKR